jgi:molybdate transport system substrate-binding protein
VKRPGSLKTENEDKPMKPILSFLALVAVVLGLSGGARAQSEITLLSPNPIKAEIDKLVADFQSKTGTKVRITYGTGVGTRKTVASGGALDATLLFAPFDDALKTGNAVPGSATVVARLRLAIAVQKGAPKPDISTVAATKATLVNAKSIISVDPAEGSVGGAVLLALEKMGIAKEVQPKIKWVRGGGEVQTAVAKGEYEIAFGPYLSDMRNPGLDIIGAVPPEAATPVDITGFLSTTAKDPAAAKALLAYLASDDAATIWRAAKAFPVR